MRVVPLFFLPKPHRRWILHDPKRSVWNRNQSEAGESAEARWTIYWTAFDFWDGLFNRP